MKKSIFILIFTFFVCPLFALTIYLREVGYAHGHYIELKEIALIHGGNSEKWNRIVIGKTGKRPKILIAEKIKQIIDSQGLTTESYTIIGGKTRVVTPFTKITQFEIETKIKKAVKKLFPTDWSRTYLIFPSDMKGVEIPLGNYRIQIEIRNAKKLYGNKRITVNVFLDNRLYKKINTSVIIQGRVKVLFARRAILPGKAISRYHVSHNEILLQKDLSNYIFSKRELPGFVSKKYIPKGSPLLRTFLKKKIIVNASQEVEIIYKRGSAAVFLEGKAMENGGLGDIITVKSAFNNKVFKARVIGAGKVEITG